MAEKDSAIYEVVMPRLGLTMTEAKIIEWLKKEGEWVAKGEILFVIENEKSTVEIEAPTDGHLRIITPIDVTVPILTPVARLTGGTVSGHHTMAEGGSSAGMLSGEHPTSADATNTSTTLSTDLTPDTSTPDTLPPASPKSRALARTLNISLQGISGSGIRGMVVAEDVQRAAARLSSNVETKPAVKASPVAQRVAEKAGLDLASVAGSGSGGRIMRGDVEKALVSKPLPSTPLPLSGLRGIIAERLSQSWRERPQVTLTTEADATNLVAARQQLNAELAAQNEKISYNALLVRLVARALAEHPDINVQLTDTGLQTLSDINIGLAVDTERGLLVPVVRDVSGKSLRQINEEINTLAERAIKGRSLPDELSGGTFTITNLGAYEIDAFTPLINPPECAILGVGRIVSKPVGLNGQIVLRDMLALSLSFDHRLVDGAPAARFLQRVKQLIERPFTLAL
jgi:pyruvate dehydrogenase E2 component (dihydrolipoamide acetyltransferase)